MPLKNTLMALSAIGTSAVLLFSRPEFLGGESSALFAFLFSGVAVVILVSEGDPHA